MQVCEPPPHGSHLCGFDAHGRAWLRARQQTPYPADVGRIDDYRNELRTLPADRWVDFLLENSHLPGPRANLELAYAVAEEASPSLIGDIASSESEFLGACGAIGLGRLLAAGDETAAARLRDLAGDPRWRVREGVAMGLQRLGDSDPVRLISLCEEWVEGGSWLVLRAVVAGICEPRLLEGPLPLDWVLDILDEATRRLAAASPEDRRTEDHRVLRKALGYCWSVAVAAAPDRAFPRFERLASVEDRDVRWVVKENLGKNRLRRADPEGCARVQAAIG